MMNRIQSVLLSAGLMLGLASSALAAPGIGDPARNVDQITDFANSGAEAWGDLQGRAVLVEFFAYW